jgi:hypothetical protein
MILAQKDTKQTRNFAVGVALLKTAFNIVMYPKVLRLASTKIKHLFALIQQR